MQQRCGPAATVFARCIGGVRCPEEAPPLTPPASPHRLLQPSGERLFTPQQLQQFDGTGGRRIYLAILGSVYDVTTGAKHYGEDMCVSLPCCSPNRGACMARHRPARGPLVSPEPEAINPALCRLKPVSQSDCLPGPALLPSPALLPGPALCSLQGPRAATASFRAGTPPDHTSLASEWRLASACPNKWPAGPAS